MYRDYSQAYLDIMDDDPNTKSYLDMLPPRYDITGREDQFKKIFKRKKDFYRRYRDLSAFCFIGVYLLSVVDAYVDAQLSEFDISPDLSMKVEPAVIGTPKLMGGTTSGRAAYGVGCSLRFWRGGRVMRLSGYEVKKSMYFKPFIQQTSSLTD